MGKYIVKRVILAIFTIFVISLITFFALNAIPGGPFNSERAISYAHLPSITFKRQKITVLLIIRSQFVSREKITR